MGQEMMNVAAVEAVEMTEEQKLENAAEQKLLNTEKAATDLVNRFADLMKTENLQSDIQDILTHVQNHPHLGEEVYSIENGVSEKTKEDGAQLQNLKDILAVVDNAKIDRHGNYKSRSEKKIKEVLPETINLADKAEQAAEDAKNGITAGSRAGDERWRKNNPNFAKHFPDGLNQEN